MAQIMLSGFGDPSANGTYEELGTHDGYPFYEKTTGDYIIIYKLENGPYSFAPAYWIIKISDIWNQRNGPVPFYTPKYKADSTDVTTAIWEAVTDETSGEGSIGAIDEDSSSSSSIDSSSSESTDESESSSSSGI